MHMVAVHMIIYNNRVYSAQWRRHAGGFGGVVS